MDWNFILMNVWLSMLLIVVMNEESRPKWLSKRFCIKLVLLLALLANGSLFIQLLILIK